MHVDRAAFGELDRVADQVAEHLAHAHRVAAHRQAHGRIEPEQQAQALVLGRALHQLQHAIQYLAQVEAGDFQLQFVGLQLGVVEDVIDDAQKLLRGRAGGV